MKTRDENLMYPCTNNDTCGYVMPGGEVDNDRCPECGSPVATEGIDIEQ